MSPVTSLYPEDLLIAVHQQVELVQLALLKACFAHVIRSWTHAAVFPLNIYLFVDRLID